MQKIRNLLTLCSLVVLGACPAGAMVFTDANQLATLEWELATTSAPGHVTAIFRIQPLDAGMEISSIDFASGQNGFLGQALRQVNPFGLPTVFNDNNGVFPEGEGSLSDTQFNFSLAELTLVPGTAHEDSQSLSATFTGFMPLRTDSVDVTFAQVVLPFGRQATFRGSFAVRPIGGGQAQLAEFGPLSFGPLFTDFDGDEDVDGADLLLWQRGINPNPLSATDLANWEANYSTHTNPASTISTVVPEPNAAVLLTLAVLSFPFILRSSTWYCYELSMVTGRCLALRKS